MATNTVPSASVHAKAQQLLSERDRWSYARNVETGVSFIAMPSSCSDRVYQVRPDGRGCSCPAYQRGGLLCSHRIAAIEAAHEDALADNIATDSEIDVVAAEVYATARARAEASERTYQRLYGED
jgi:hypothetical protein